MRKEIEVPEYVALKNSLSYLLIKSLVQGLLLLLGPLKVKGAYRVPKSGGVLIIANHLSDIDPVVLQAACPRRIHYMSKSELFDMPRLGPLIRAYGAFPVKRGEADRAALKFAAGLLKVGEVVGIFPEGELSESGELLPLKPGLALIVRLAGTPVICCGFDGTNRMMPYGKMIPRPAFHTVPVEWGEPRTFDKSATTEEIMAWVEGQLRALSAP